MARNNYQVLADAYANPYLKDRLNREGVSGDFAGILKAKGETLPGAMSEEERSLFEYFVMMNSLGLMNNSKGGKDSSCVKDGARVYVMVQIEAALTERIPGIENTAQAYKDCLGAASVCDGYAVHPVCGIVCVSAYYQKRYSLITGSLFQGWGKQD